MSSNSSSDKLASAAAIDALAAKCLLRPDARLDRAVANSRKQGLPPIAVTPLQGQFLALQCQLLGAKSVLEIGTLGGYSTAWMAQTGAKVTSIELNPHHRAVALDNLAGLDVDVILGSALDVLPRLHAEGRCFDFVFIDADWDEQWQCFDWAVRLTRQAGCIYVDNVVRQLLETGAATDHTRASLVSHVGKDPRVRATLVPTVSSHKGVSEEMFDGFLLAVVQ